MVYTDLRFSTITVEKQKVGLLSMTTRSETEIFDALSSNWNDLIRHIRIDSGITDISFQTWLEPLSFHAYQDGIVYILIPSDNQITLQYIEGHFMNFFRVTLSEFLEQNVDISFILQRNAFNIVETDETADSPAPRTAVHTTENPGLNPKYRFDTFVVGSNNELARQASVAVAESPGEAYNPLFLYGGPGLGKTHLMHSIGHFILENRPGSKVLYVTSENFTNDVISSIRSGKQDHEQMSRLRNKYRTVDVLMVDDVQFIIGKEQTQEEFFNTFNELYQSGKQIVLSSDKPPKEMVTLEERFRSRFNMGLVADIQPPDYETRMAILKNNAENNAVNIDDSVFDYIASNVTTNIRDLEGAYNKIIADARLLHLPYEQFTVEFAEKALKDIIIPDSSRKISIPVIVSAVCSYYNIREDELLSRRRTSEVVLPRQIAMYLCRELTDSPLEEIGKQLGKKDHTTVINGINKIKSNIQSDDDLSRVIDQIRKKLGVVNS